MTVVGVSNVGLVDGGEWDGWKCIGHSVAFGANGQVLAQEVYGENAEELLFLRYRIDSDFPRGVFVINAHYMTNKWVIRGII